MSTTIVWRWRWLNLLAAAVGLVALSAGSAVGAGAVMGADIVAWRALVVWDVEILDVQLQPIVATDGAGPVAVAATLPLVEEVLEPQQGLLTDLDAATRPVVTLPGTPASGCDGEATPGDPIATDLLPGDAADAPEVAATFQEERDPPSVTGLVEELTADGIAPSEAIAQQLSDRVNAGDDLLVARYEVEGAGTWALAPMALRVRKPAKGRLPLAVGLASGGGSDPLPVSIWVLAPDRFRVENQASVTLDTVATEVAAQLAADEEASYVEALDALGASVDGRLFVTELALPVDEADLPVAIEALAADGEVVTRLSARVAEAGLDDAIVAVGIEAVDVTGEAEVPGPAPSAAWVALGLVLVGAVRRRRSLRR